MNMRALGALGCLTLFGLNSCATHKAETGAAIGAGAGAVVGGVIGSKTGSTTAGVIIGAVVGGATGAIIGARMDAQARELQQNIPGATVTRVGEGIAVTFASGLLFDFNSDAIRPDAASNLQKLASSLDKYPDTNLLIVGHTDATGDANYNQGLSERRASSAMSYLASLNVNPTRIKAVGRGETEPIADNDSDAGRAQNRRIEVAIFANEAARRGGQ